MAGNSLNEATKITLGRTNRFSGQIRSNDPVDFYSFSINRSSQVSLVLRNLSADLDLALLDQNGNEILTSDFPNQASEVITPPVLAEQATLPGRLRPYFETSTRRGTAILGQLPLKVGTYFIRIRQVEGSTQYRLDATAIADARFPPPRRAIPPVSQDRLNTARVLNFNNTRQRQLEGSVSRSQNEVFYRFSFDRPRLFSALMRNLDNNADMALLDVAGNTIVRSTNSGNASEVIAPRRALAEGVYYLRVYQVEGNTDFDLTLTAVVDRANPQPSQGRQPNLVRDIRSGTASSNPSSLFNFNGSLLFAADNGINGTELWRSNGTAAGTQLLLDLNPLGSSNPSGFVQVGNVVYFAADNGRNGTELWRTDGTVAGTRQVADINFGAASSNPASLVNFNGVLYFSADNGVNGRELWRSDGTAAGTDVVVDINPAGSSDPSSLVVFNNQIYFAATNGILGTELWRSNGTAAGTQLVRDINTGAASSNPSSLQVYNNQLYFSASDGINGTELWSSDGTTAGTRLFSNISAGNGSSNPSELVVVSNTLFFAADSPLTGRELWSTDGRSPRLVANINPGTRSSNPSSLIAVNNVLYFVADNGINGNQIWRSTGTAANTTRLTTTTLTTFNPTELENINNILFFSANTVSTGTELFSLQT